MLDAVAPATIFQSAFMEPTKLGPLLGSSNRNGAAMEDYRTLLSPDTCGALRACDWPKAPRAPRLLHGPRANHLAHPADHPAVSGVGAPAHGAEDPRRSRLFAGAALAALHPIACHDHPIGALWRQRLALANAAALARHAGRSEDEAALRDAWYLRRAGDDPGPAGRLLQAWRRLVERDPLDKAIRLALRPKDWMVDLTNALDLPVDDALEDVGDAAETLAVGEGSAIAAAAQVAAVSLQKRPDAEALALWLADAVLAHRVRWPAPVPLIAGQIRRSDLRAAARPDGDAWQTTWSVAYARAAAAAADLYAELTRRAHHLLAAAPQLRARDAARRVEILLTEDAQAATAGARATDRSSRRLFERLVAMGAARELTGRPTFRLYGL
jgi:hypothetical protein